MSALTFTLRAAPLQRLDLSCLTPDGLAGLSPREIEALPLARAIRAGDVFAVSGVDAGDIRFEGGSERFDWIGHGMAQGSIHVTGDAGAKLGRGMSGGSITVSGGVGAHAGSGLSGGLIRIGGDAGDDLGGPLAGEIAGMRGGVILVGGNVGHEAGHRLRRGTICIAGHAGENACRSMIAGTVVILGRAETGAGTLMRRGTLVIGQAPELSPGFVDCGATDLAFTRVLGGFLAELGVKPGRLFRGPLRRFQGDMATLGKGEVLTGLG